MMNEKERDALLLDIARAVVACIAVKRADIGGKDAILFGPELAMMQAADILAKRVNCIAIEQQENKPKETK